MPERSSKLLLLGLLALVAWASQLPRRVAHDKLAVPGIDGWVAHDPDTLYQVRRVARVLGGEDRVASTDPYLNFPHGARIPWPPYYTRLVAAVVGRDLPEEFAQRRLSIERRVASVPLVLGVATSLAAALLALLVAGPAAGLFAGIYHALCIASIAYSRIGNGDHHAFIALLLCLELGVFTWMARAGFRSARAGIALGVLAGVIAGWMLGAWVASLLYVLMLQGILGVFLFLHGRRALPGLAPFGLGFHLSALLVALPAILGSPWKEEYPWMVVNLSWFHGAHLLLGAAVFLPLPALSERARRRYPWLLGLALALLVFGVFAVDAGPGRGIREGFEWVSRADQFMSGIQESRPLLTFAHVDGAEILRLLGYGAPLLPVVWIVGLWHVLRSGRHHLIPLLVAVPLLAVQAGAQARFADALAAPMAAMLGWCLAQVPRLAKGAAEASVPRRNAVARAAGLGLMLVVAVAAQGRSALPIWKDWRARGFAPRITPRRAGAVRSMLEWIRTHTPESGDFAVLANWNQGHGIEWGADRPSVATNFGSYVGLDSYADPGRFFLGEDAREAEALLDARRARYVLHTSAWPNALPDMIRAACPEREERYLEQVEGRAGRLRDAWFRTIGARLMFDGGSHPRSGLAAGERLDFLRLVHVSPTEDPRPKLAGYVERSPMGWVWEHVRGARIEARAEPGSELAVEFDVEFGLARTRFTYTAKAFADGEGRARLRVPYCTQGSNGDGYVTGEARWRLGDESGPLVITEADVLTGATVTVPARR